MSKSDGDAALFLLAVVWVISTMVALLSSGPRSIGAGLVSLGLMVAAGLDNRQAKS